MAFDKTLSRTLQCLAWSLRWVLLLLPDEFNEGNSENSVPLRTSSYSGGRMLLFSLSLLEGIDDCEEKDEEELVLALALEDDGSSDSVQEEDEYAFAVVEEHLQS